jgi:hypothetical protein
MPEIHYGVIETATGDLVRCGFSDFTSTLIAGESQRSDCPFPGQPKRKTGLSQIHRWNGSAWVLVTFATGSGIVREGTVRVATPVAGLTIPSKETWYTTDNGDGTYSGKTRETAYTYDGDQKLTQKTDTTYYSDGVICSTQSYAYVTNKLLETIEKRAVV